MCTINNRLFKKIIVLFWTFWWLIALWTDAVGALAHVKILSADWAPDINYPSLVDSLNMYDVSSWVPSLLFTFILLWSLISAGLFCWASLGLRYRREIWMARTEMAFVVSLTYWFAFFIADQLVMKFGLEQNHMVQGGFQLLTFLSLYLLPENHTLLEKEHNIDFSPMGRIAYSVRKLNIERALQSMPPEKGFCLACYNLQTNL